MTNNFRHACLTEAFTHIVAISLTLFLYNRQSPSPIIASEGHFSDPVRRRTTRSGASRPRCPRGDWFDVETCIQEDFCHLKVTDLEPVTRMKYKSCHKHCVDGYSKSIYSNRSLDIQVLKTMKHAQQKKIAQQ